MYNNKLLLFNEEEKEKILRTNKNVIIDSNNENLKKYVLEALNDKKSNKYIYLGVIPKETIVRIKNEVTDIKQNKINLVLDEDKRYDLVISQEEIRHLKKESLEESDIVDFVHNISNIIINFDNVEKIILAIMGAVLSGIGYGLVYKSGYTTGGTDIINQIISKYTHITVGKAMRITDGLIVLSSKLVFPWETILYGYVVLYIITTLSDKILFGRSKCKTFYIVTEHYDEVKEYILSIFNGVTLIDARSGYDNEKKKLLLVVIPTNQYYFVKDVLKEIDKDIFFMVSDAYEIGMKGDLNEG